MLGPDNGPTGRSMTETLSYSSLSVVVKLRIFACFTEVLFLDALHRWAATAKAYILQRQLPRSIMLVQVPNQLMLSEEAIQSDDPRRRGMTWRLVRVNDIVLLSVDCHDL
ncbi:Hypothetical_protein [Hexamita inflata]|uniref:Hypothetical_protein n=1 Tax=Hexamita inflata TaxID=28002 RepID=A0AA86P2U5_9EUKA|nr:Hypothetical protein HINF_LOCUS18193 [Hexamita inflata]